MIVCVSCGHQNRGGDSFCGSCGEFLEWTGEKSEPHPAMPVAPAEPAEAPLRQTATDQPPLEPAGTVEAAPPESGVLIQPAARQPEAMKPAAARARPAPRTQQVPSRVIQPGDLICGQCGEGNAPERRFCRRCGASLAEAIVMPEPPLSWWRRLLRRLRPRRVVVPAGERPGRASGGGAGPGVRVRARRGLSRATGLGFRVVALLGLLGVALTFVGPWKEPLQDRIERVTDRIRRVVSPRFVLVNPIRAESTSELSGHPAAAAMDMKTNTYWAEGAKGSGEGQVIAFVFASPVDLDKVRFFPGADSKPGEFVTQPRPKDLHVVFSDGTSKDIALNDSAKPQVFDVKARGVDRIEVRLVSAYPSVQGDACSLAEVEFLTRQ